MVTLGNEDNMPLDISDAGKFIGGALAGGGISQIASVFAEGLKLINHLTAEPDPTKRLMMRRTFLMKLSEEVRKICESQNQDVTEVMAAFTVLFDSM